MSVTILQGDCREVLKTLPDESVQCVVTSPPYWGLRDYGNGDTGIGLEPTIGEHIEALVEVFGEVRRVLRKDGTLWLNYGDAYASAGGAGWQGKNGQRADRRFTASRDTVGMREITRRPPASLKPKDLIGLPWRLAFALQADGWWLRSDIIWAKPNPMPESVTDRPTRAHEYMFLLAKAERYRYDADAISEPCSENTHARVSQNVAAQKGSNRAHAGSKTNGPMKAVVRKPGVTPKSADEASNVKAKVSFHSSTTAILPRRNARTVWTIASEAFPEAHFATFPTELARRCVLTGCPEGETVLDPFGGAGTVGLVADRLKRNAILIEMNPSYCDMARRRIAADAPLFAEVTG